MATNKKIQSAYKNHKNKIAVNQLYRYNELLVREEIDIFSAPEYLELNKEHETMKTEFLETLLEMKELKKDSKLLKEILEKGIAEYITMLSNL